MAQFFYFFKRNVKLFFKDKGMVLSSLITPIILLVLYATFLKGVFEDSFLSALPEGVEVSEKFLGGFVGGELTSSLLAVSCVTVAFCSNFICVQDKVNGVRSDILVAPVKKSTVALGYYAAAYVSTLIVCLIATLLCFIYLACVGWYLSFGDAMLILADVIILTLFGTLLSSIINGFLTSEGQISAVGTIVSAGYGFICGAYMPMSSFGAGLKNVLTFLPGTYGTSLIRNHFLGGVFRDMSSKGVPAETVEGIKKSVDCSLEFFGNDVSIGASYAVVLGAIAVLLGIYLAINVISVRKKHA